MFERQTAPRRVTSSRVVPAARAALVRLAVVTLCTGAALVAQESTDRLRTMPGYRESLRMNEALAIAPAFEPAAPATAWADDSGSFTYTWNGKRRTFDLVTMHGADVVEAPAPRVPTAPSRRGPTVRRASGACPSAVIERGRQSACEPSPDGAWKAYYRDRNLYLSEADGAHEVAISADGSVAARVKYGVASWVYGEELDQTTAIWWAPDSRKVAFYRFDERGVKDYFLPLKQTDVQDALDVEAYPKAGADNPMADVLVYDVQTHTTTTLDVRDGRPFGADVVGYYVYGMTWAADGSELRMNRTDRRQHVMEYVGCQPTSAKCRVIVREEHQSGWTETHPTIRALADGGRFVWATSRTGRLNYELRDFSGALLNRLSDQKQFDAGDLVRVDEQAGALFYMARDGDNFMKRQLHRVGLDGRNDVRLTDPAFTHDVQIAPNGAWFVDVYQTHDRAPALRVVDRDGRVAAELGQSDLSRFTTLGARPVEVFNYKSADGDETLYGTIGFPSTFDASKRYPVLIAVYGGPDSENNSPNERFSSPDPLAEYGFLLVQLSSRAVSGLGTRALDAIYRRLGQADVDDFAEGVRALGRRPYVDPSRVGIFGTSYGGYTALMGLLRYPTLFAAASVSSPVTDWRNYDTIYTERYMGLPSENADGYEKGSAMTYAANLRGRLLLYYGTADNNVHPANSLQLVRALAGAGKSFELQVGADAEHSAIGTGRMMEFFVEHLVVHPERPMSAGAN